MNDDANGGCVVMTIITGAISHTSVLPAREMRAVRSILQVSRFNERVRAHR
jgi:hypothetical protein